MVLGVVTAVASLFVLLVGAAFAPILFEDESFLLLPFVPLPFLALYSLIRAFAARRRNRHLLLRGLRCWGRVLNASAAGGLRRTRGLRWLQMKILVQSHALPAEASRPLTQPSPTEPIELCWYVSELQLPLLQSGAWCAFLLDPDDRRHHYLDGFVSAQGQFHGVI